MKNKTTAGLLAIFLGGLGIHRFYLRQTGLGILYIVFCLLIIPSIIALIDGIIFLTQSDEAFNSKYNKGVLIPSMVKDVADELLKLNNLKEQGVITEQEFQNRKSALLA